MAYVAWHVHIARLCGVARARIARCVAYIACHGHVACTSGVACAAIRGTPGETRCGPHNRPPSMQPLQSRRASLTGNCPAPSWLPPAELSRNRPRPSPLLPPPRRGGALPLAATVTCPAPRPAPPRCRFGRGQLEPVWGDAVSPFGLRSRRGATLLLPSPSLSPSSPHTRAASGAGQRGAGGSGRGSAPLGAQVLGWGRMTSPEWGPPPMHFAAVRSGAPGRPWVGARGVVLTWLVALRNSIPVNPGW